MDSKLYSKCEILFDLSMKYGNDPMWKPYFDVYDVGVPLARFIVMDWATPTESGIECIEEAWVDLCRLIMVDPEGEYEMLDDMVAIGAIEDES